MTTKEEAIAAAGEVLARIRQDLIERPPRESALAAYVPGGPSVEELEARIRALLVGTRSGAEQTLEGGDQTPPLR